MWAWDVKQSTTGSASPPDGMDLTIKVSVGSGPVSVCVPGKGVVRMRATATEAQCDGNVNVELAHGTRTLGLGRFPVRLLARPSMVVQVWCGDPHTGFDIPRRRSCVCVGLSRVDVTDAPGMDNVEVPMMPSAPNGNAASEMPRRHPGQSAAADLGRAGPGSPQKTPVSYTHLTLPTKA